MVLGTHILESTERNRTGMFDVQCGYSDIVNAVELFGKQKHISVAFTFEL